MAVGRSEREGGFTGAKVSQIEVVIMNVWQKERNARTIVFSICGVVDPVEGCGRGSASRENASRKPQERKFERYLRTWLARDQKVSVKFRWEGRNEGEGGTDVGVSSEFEW